MSENTHFAGVKWEYPSIKPEGGRFRLKPNSPCNRLKLS